MSLWSKTGKASDIDILDLATWFLSKEPMSQKKIQKLCYYAVAWGWALKGRAIASRSEFEAWVHGPVNRVLRDKYIGYGWSDIQKAEVSKKLSQAEDGVVSLLEAVWRTYGDKNGDQLEILSHQEKPWIEARAGAGEFEPSSNKIKPETMREFYLSIYNK